MERLLLSTIVVVFFMCWHVLQCDWLLQTSGGGAAQNRVPFNVFKKAY